MKGEYKIMKKMMIAVIAVLAAVSVVRAEVQADFDSSIVTGMAVLRAAACKNYKYDADHSVSEPVPVLSTESRQDYLKKLPLNREDRMVISQKLPDGIAAVTVKTLIQDEKVVVLFNGNKVFFTESAGKEIYNVILESNSGLLVKLLSEAESRSGDVQQNKSWVTMCIEIVKWAIFIKDGIEVGGWVTEKVCEQKWVDGNGEGGHIPPLSEGHVRSLGGFSVK